MRPRVGTALAVAGLLGAALYLSLPLLRCVDACYVDYIEVFGFSTGNFAIPDARLNSWILAWVQHALFDPAGLFDANAFHPAANTLAGSEHMLGVALQLLPFRLLGDGAVFLHQTALLLSFPLLALTTFALTRWITGSVWAAAVAGVVTMFMPWRHSVVPHVQLLSAQWFPLVWLLCLRIGLDAKPRRDAALLALVLAVQALSSFYLAYFAYLSVALLALCIAWLARPERQRLALLGAGLAAPALLVAATSLPYLDRYPAYDFPVALALRTDPGTMWSFIAPSPSLLPDHERLDATTYYMPLALFGLALVAIAGAVRRRGDDAPARTRVATVGLVAVCLGAFAMMLGRVTLVGGVEVPMPGWLAAQLVPGFSQLRAEFRWAILIGIALPVLAGVGIHVLDRRLRRPPLDGLRFARPVAHAVVAGLVAAGTAWFQLPARDAWDRYEDVLVSHRALAPLADGAIVELPWRPHRIHLASLGSSYMLASALHWQPLLNGYSAYVPPSHHFLQRVASRLPDEQALEQLRRLTDLRWVVLHPGRMKPRELAAWERAESEGRVRRAAGGDESWIYEVPRSAESGRWMADLRSPATRDTTFTGISRASLDLPERAGHMQATMRRRMRFELAEGIPERVTLSLRNDTDVAWPGFDLQPQGLVRLRAHFTQRGGGHEETATWPLDADVPPRAETRAVVQIRPPAVPGPYRLRLDLVQEVDGVARPLGVAPVVSEVEVVERPPMQRPAHRGGDA